MTAPVPKRADQLVVGDRIPEKHQLYKFNKGLAEVRFVDTDGDEAHIIVLYRYPNGRHDSMSVRAEAVIEVVPADTGQLYSRPDTDPQPSGGREPMHTGGMTDGGLVDESEEIPPWNPETGFFQPGRVPELVGDDLPRAVSCQGAPAGFEADCGVAGPHGPHGAEPASEVR